MPEMTARCELTLAPEIQIEGKWLNAAACASRGLRLTENIHAATSHLERRLRVENNSGAVFRLGGFRWHRQGHHNEFFDMPAEQLRLYLEGWTMASPCGTKRFGDRDFDFDPGYIAYAVCEPQDHNDTIPNHFRAEYMVAIHNAASGQSLLTGFITSADQFGRFVVKLDENGVAEYSAVSGGDGREVDPGEAVDSETLAIIPGDDGNVLFRRFAELWGERMQARKHFPPPVGWCSWYYYFDKVSEADVFENVRFLAAHREQYPLQYIQVDDGYQTALGDWLSCNEKFPHGLEALAAGIREAGFRPALWLGPFMVEENSELLKQHPEWMIHDHAGQVMLPFNWREGHRVAVLDGTHPEVQSFFRDLFAKLRKMGFEYVKLDFMMLASSVRDGVLYDRKATRAQALRRGLAAIRDGFGDDGFILGCTVPLGPVVGLVDGERISTDITPYWTPDRKWYSEAPTVPNVCRNVINHAYMNHRLWINDPDTIIVRDDNTKLTQNEVELWADAVRLVGGMLLLSDRLETLTPERAELLRPLLAEPDAGECHAVDLWENTIPQQWLSINRKTGEKLLGVFNFSDGKESIHVENTVLEMPPHSSRLI